MKSLPGVTRAEYRGGYRIRLTFNDGLAKIVDFSEWLYGPIFEPLEDTDYFQRFFFNDAFIDGE